MSTDIKNDFRLFNVYFHEVEAILLAQDLPRYSFVIWSPPQDIRELTLTTDDFQNGTHKFHHYAIERDKDQSGKYRYSISRNCMSNSLEGLIKILKSPDSLFMLHTHIISDKSAGDAKYKLRESALSHLERNKEFNKLTFFHSRPESRYLPPRSNDIRPYQVSNERTRTTENIETLMQHFSKFSHLFPSTNIGSNTWKTLPTKESVHQTCSTSTLNDNNELRGQNLSQLKPRIFSVDTNDIPTNQSNFNRGRTRHTISEKRVQFNLGVSRKEEHELNLSNLSPTNKATDAINGEKVNVLKTDGIPIQDKEINRPQLPTIRKTTSPIEYAVFNPTPRQIDQDSVKIDSVSSSISTRPNSNFNSIPYVQTFDRSSQNSSNSPNITPETKPKSSSEYLTGKIYEKRNPTQTDPTSGKDNKTILPKPCEIHYEALLGEGYFANVYRARINEELFAVKMIKPTQVFDVREAKTLLGMKHPNIIKCFGVLNLPDTDTLLVFEYMGGGCLEEYLKSDTSIGIGLMKSWAQQIANGMRYIEQQRMVHRDLAARNILLDTSKTTAKIGDFGLARQLDPNDIYTMNTQPRFPVRWQSIEVLEDMVGKRKPNFTIKNDVWGFSVLLYEIYSNGKLPYENMHDNYNIYEYLSEGIGGGRLERPKNTPDDIYELMTKCWDKNPKERPSFDEIYTFLKNSK